MRTTTFLTRLTLCTVRAPGDEVVAPGVHSRETGVVREQRVGARVVWGAIACCIVLLAVHSVTQFGGESAHDFLDDWVANAAEWAAAVMCLVALAQLVALGIQVYGLFHHVPLGERVITIVVLVIAIVQIVATRPAADPHPVDIDPAEAETVAH